MKIYKCLISAIAVFLFLNVIFPENAYAYLDPGSGSYLLQLLLAGLFGALFAVKIFWKKIVDFFRNLFSRG